MLVKKEKVTKLGNSTVVKLDSSMLGKDVYIFDEEAYEDLIKLSFWVGRGSQ